MADKKPRLSLKGLSPEEMADVLNKHYGENTVVVSSKARGLRVDFISTGCYRLDSDCGGGIPKNRITEIKGPYSALKTTLGYKTIASFQEEDPTNIAVLLDFEKAHDPVYADLLGIDADRLYIINPDSGEQGINVLNDLMTVDFHLFALVDSIAAIVPTAEIESDIEQILPGIQARLINKMMRTLVARMKRSLYDPTAPTTTVLCNNQIREKIGVMFGSPETSPGGRGKDFAYSMMITVRSGSGGKIIEERPKNGVTKKVRMGQRVTYEITKNKVSGSQFTQGEFNYYIKPFKGYPAFSFDNAEALIEVGLYYGTIQLTKIPNPRDKKKSIDAYTYDDLGPLSEEKFRLALIADPEAASYLHRANLDAITEDNLGKSDSDDDDDASDDEDDDDERVVVTLGKQNGKIRGKKVKIKKLKIKKLKKYG